MVRNEVKFSEYKKHINEGDILLFRGTNLISKFIRSSSETPYSHVGVASWINGKANTNEGILECVEFREGSLLAGLFGFPGGGGGRSVNLKQQVKKYSGLIDVYRVSPIFFSYKLNDNKEIILSEKAFDGKSVTTIMRQMTGLPYGWRRVWWMFKHKLLCYRLSSDYQSITDDNLNDIVYPVCSTALSYAHNVNGFDLVNNRNDEWTEPGDIAKSSQTHYLFTLKCDE